MPTKKLALYGVLTSIMLVLGFVERQFLIAPGIPGIRLGLANTVLLYAVCLMGTRSAWLLMGVKVALSSVLFAGFTGFLYSLAGGVCSMLAMALAMRLRGVSLIGVSVLGSVLHMVGQLLVASLLTGLSLLAGFLAPLLLISGVVMGVVTGVVAQGVCAALAKTDPDMRKRLERFGHGRNGR